MKRRVFSVIIAIGMVLGLFFGSASAMLPGSTAYAVNDLNKGITIDDEFLIPDTLGWCTYYVVVATNNTGSDIAITADFVARDSSGNVLKKVNDYSDAVKKGQQFILYGQFVNTSIKKAASYQYSYNVSTTDKCAYSLVSVDTKSADKGVEVSATNSSTFDVQGVGVRTVFKKNGKAVAFDTVNIADRGTVFKGGSTNSQVVGMNAGDYDDYVITYTSVSNTAVTEGL